MFDRHHRKAFLETLCELRGAFGDDVQVMWKAEYITRELRHFQYYGIHRAGHVSTAGCEMSDRDGFNQDSDPENMLAVMLRLMTNGRVASYRGDMTNPREIAASLGRFDDPPPEVARLSIERRGKTIDGRKLVIVTNVAYLGFRTSIPAPAKDILAAMPEISRHWCRDRHYIAGLAAPVKAPERVRSRMEPHLPERHRPKA